MVRNDEPGGERELLALVEEESIKRYETSGPSCFGDCFLSMINWYMLDALIVQLVRSIVSLVMTHVQVVVRDLSHVTSHQCINKY